MGNGEGSAPYEAQDAAEFIEAMRRLKERSGLTYRQLEEKAAGQGEPLPRSTLANALTGRSLPRPELLAAFVRACGEGDRAAEWTRARSLIAERSRTASPPPPEPPTPPLTPWGGTRRTPTLLTFAALLTAAAIATIWTLTSPGTSSGTSSSASSDGPPAHRSPDAAPPPLPTGPVRIHPLSAPDLCLTDGHVPDGRYDSLVAVQRPCDEVAPQRTRLIPAGAGMYRIEWFRPDQGRGCLAARSDGPAAGLLEPQNDCAAATRLHIEPAATHGGTTYAFRAEATRRCLAINTPTAPKAAAEAVLTPCAPKKSQLFRITPAPSE